MNEEAEKKPITKCWSCQKELFDNSEFVVIRWAPGSIGSYCHDCNVSNNDD